MANVLFDHNVFTRVKRGGVSRYFCNILHHLNKCSHGIDAVKHTLVAPFHNNEMLTEVTSRPFHWRIPVDDKFSVKIMGAINETALRVTLATRRYNVIHETHYSGRSYTDSKIAPVFTVHDLIPELFPIWFQDYGKILARRQRAFTMNADFVCVSQKTAEDFMELFKVKSERVHVIPHGTTHLTAAIGASRREDMILYVGSRGKYKNFMNFIKGIGQNSRLADSIELVAFGGGPFTTAEKEMLALHNIRRSRQLDGDDRQLALAYAEASVFVYPSSYEGFGLPLLEAMALDCPVACADTSCFPEIAGNAAAYFDPNSSDAIGAAISMILDDRAFREGLIQRGRARMAEFSWKASGNAHRALYQAIAER